MPCALVCVEAMLLCIRVRMVLVNVFIEVVTVLIGQFVGIDFVSAPNRLVTTLLEEMTLVRDLRRHHL